MSSNNPLRNTSRRNCNYKLYKAKKQWTIGCAVAFAMLSLGYTSVAYADNEASGNPLSQETSLQESSLNHTKDETSQIQSATSTSNTPTSNLETDNNNPTGTEFERQFNQNASQRSQSINNQRNTQTVFGSHNIDPNNYQIQFHHVDGLTYQIPPYQLVDGDLRFATDEEVSHISKWTQPKLVSGKPVNVGTYLVFLSETGYNHIEAWVNGIEEEGKWVPRPDVHNLVLPPYNLQTLVSIANYSATFKINPYKVKVELTGEAPLTNQGLDLSQYHINLLSNGSDQASIKQYNDQFQTFFQLQPGDLKAGSTPTSPNHYPVTLTQQGQEHVLSILQQVFASSGKDLDHKPNFSWDPVKDVDSKASATLNDEQKEITRTINVYRPGEANPSVYKQVATIHRSASVGDKGQLVWGNWSTATWPSFSAPSVNGYQASPQSVAEILVTSETADETVNIHYSKLPDPNASDTKNPEHGNSSTGNVLPNGSSTNNNRLNRSAVNSQQTQSLPQTGNEANVASLAGLGILSLAMMLGVAKKHREEN